MFYVTFDLIYRMYHKNFKKCKFSIIKFLVMRPSNMMLQKHELRTRSNSLTSLIYHQNSWQLQCEINCQLTMRYTQTIATSPIHLGPNANLIAIINIQIQFIHDHCVFSLYFRYDVFNGKSPISIPRTRAINSETTQCRIFSSLVEPIEHTISCIQFRLLQLHKLFDSDLQQ